eukprot:m.1121549 g.1121549  ORF g.1121549 m.1121549 type:complete len:815 (+) comp24399_c0_seq5:134-2578(+)
MWGLRKIFGGGNDDEDAQDQQGSTIENSKHEVVSEIELEADHSLVTPSPATSTEIEDTTNDTDATKGSAALEEPSACEVIVEDGQDNSQSKDLKHTFTEARSNIVLDKVGSGIATQDEPRLEDVEHKTAPEIADVETTAESPQDPLKNSSTESCFDTSEPSKSSFDMPQTTEADGGNFLQPASGGSTTSSREEKNSPGDVDTGAASDVQAAQDDRCDVDQQGKISSESDDLPPSNQSRDTQSSKNPVNSDVTAADKPLVVDVSTGVSVESGPTARSPLPTTLDVPKDAAGEEWVAAGRKSKKTNKKDSNTSRDARANKHSSTADSSVGVPVSGGNTRGSNKGATVTSPSVPGTVIRRPNGSRILLLADVQGYLSSINYWAKKTSATHVVCTGTFGFFPTTWGHRVPVRQHSNRDGATSAGATRAGSSNELAMFVNGDRRFGVPVYTVWGPSDDLDTVLRFRSGDYSVGNLFILDEHHTYAIDGLRLLGLGGGFETGKLLDGGEGNDSTIAGGEGTMWTTLLQIGELLSTARKALKPSEARLLVSNCNPFVDTPFITILATELQASVVVMPQTHTTQCTVVTHAAVRTFDAMTTAMSSCANEVQTMWAQVSDQVREMATPEYFALIDRAVTCTEVRPSQFHFKHALHVGALSMSARNAAVLNVTAFATVAVEPWGPGVDYAKLRSAERNRQVKKDDGRAIGAHRHASGDSSAKRSYHKAHKIEIVPTNGSWGKGGPPSMNDVSDFMQPNQSKYISMPRGKSIKVVVSFHSEDTMNAVIQSAQESLLGKKVTVRPFVQHHHHQQPHTQRQSRHPSK